MRNEVTLGEAPIQSQELADPQELSDRLAVLCFVPDPGHLIPLLKIAAQVRDAIDVLVLVPDELVDLASAFGFDVAGVGLVRPEGGTAALQRYTEASRWERFSSAHAIYKQRYKVPLRKNTKQSVHRYRELLANYRPTCLLCDGNTIAREGNKNFGLNVPIFLHYPAINMKRHNTWSLRSAQWEGTRATMRDALEKSKNEVRLWLKGWSARRTRIDAAVEIGRLPPIPAATCGLTYLADGTSFLENALLRHRLLDLGSDRLVLPTIPPLETPLPQELGAWLDRCPDGDVIYVSFGTLLQPDPAVMTSIVRAGLARGKQVLLQYSGDVPALPGMRHERWVPQATVLSHPAVSLFIAHGGAGSVEESLWYGKPLLCLPNVWDHFYISWIASLLGAGVTVPRRAVNSPRRLAAGIRKALKPERADSARFVSGLMRKHWSDNQAAVKDLFRVSARTPRSVDRG